MLHRGRRIPMGVRRGEQLCDDFWEEPSLLFYSNSAGSGNSSLYHLKIPSDPPVMPNQSGTAGTWNFQLHPAFWLGMALCDNQSAPEFTHAPCVADSDTNIFDNGDDTAADYIGHHPGAAFLEVQFYPPGWAPWPPGVSCDASKWCASMAIFSFNSDQNTGVPNDDDGCFSASFSLLVPIGGCIATDNDFDGVPYQTVWPGTNPNRGQDKKYHPSPIVFTSPVFNGSQNYSRLAFEADLPRIEAADFGGSCNRFTGTGCTNPPPGANFYPIYSTGVSAEGRNGHCVWQFGGPYLKGTTNTFGGNSAAEFGPLLFSFYPGIPVRTNNFRNVLSSNPCPA